MAEPTNPLDPHSRHTAPTLDLLADKWGWFVALGAILLILGLIAAAHVLAATLVSVLYVGILMLIAGVGQLIQAWRVKHWKGFFIWSISGLLYLAAGILAIFNPVAGAALLTLLLGAALIGSGAFRLWAWSQHRSRAGWQWMVLSGIVTLAAGILIAANWPGNSLWILGLVLAIDLLFQGWSLLLLGFLLRRGSSNRKHVDQ